MPTRNIKARNFFSAIVIVLIFAGIFIYSQIPHNQEATAQTPIAQSVTQTPKIAWSFEKKGNDASTDAQITKVTVDINGKKYDAGTYNASCGELAAANLSKNEISGVLCWWAGFGDEVGVFKENKNLEIKHREIQEGSAEVPTGTMTEFKTILSIQ